MFKLLDQFGSLYTVYFMSMDSEHENVKWHQFGSDTKLSSVVEIRPQATLNKLKHNSKYTR
jgi:hypothetical protein